jgi:hypothetical protein
VVGRLEALQIDIWTQRVAKPLHHRHGTGPWIPRSCLACATTVVLEDLPQRQAALRADRFNGRWESRSRAIFNLAG